MGALSSPWRSKVKSRNSFLLLRIPPQDKAICMACGRSLHYYSLSLMQSGDTLGLACLRGGLIPRKTHLATQMSVTETHMFSLQFARNLSDFEQASLDPELSL